MSLTKRVLLIDDDDDDRELFLDIVNQLGMSTVPDTAINGADGLAKLLACAELPEMIFLDLNMPVMNGKEFLRKIKEVDELKDIPVVILTTSDDAQTIHETKALGAAGFITKPNRIMQWKSVLKEFIV